ncbi:hypothetical protein [Candidatus Symbiobacter mobilis]|uniref:Uncharacterized protein n=1 Tax=Candidatus Symbiobacter mobilis CR TaxID=946483 RepID=U5N9U6_9BURK|nr:hypothetical protein [Candidatus Symbiobacter mobilis]AGX88182.1 hypothetical protein Cenrod_2111 [Candidatus Symbiobacter mobilis CR]
MRLGYGFPVVALRITITAAITALGYATAAHSAPWDALLQATPPADKAYLELSTDHLNGALDVFRVREDDPANAGTPAGDFHSVAISGGAKVAGGNWLSASLGRKSLRSASDAYHYTSWQVSAMHPLEWIGGNGTWAARLSAWGNHASATESTTAIVVPGARLRTVHIDKPEDRQIQADVVGSWKVWAGATLSAHVGIGKTKLSYQGMEATTKRNGCLYHVTFWGNTMLANLIPPCNVGGIVMEQLYDRSGLYGVDIPTEIAWRGNFAQVGGNVQWQRGAWTFNVGYLYHYMRRNGVDGILAGRGARSYQRNEHLLFQASYPVRPGWTVYGRAQTTSHLLLDDIPVTYNSSTAKRFGSGHATFGVGVRRVW